MKRPSVVQPNSVDISNSIPARDNSVATALRAKGFVPLPRLWVHGDALPELKKITDRYREEVNQTRADVGRAMGRPLDATGSDDYGPLPIALSEDKEAAWAAYEAWKNKQGKET
jgi:hypothetical protein